MAPPPKVKRIMTQPIVSVAAICSGAVSHHPSCAGALLCLLPLQACSAQSFSHCLAALVAMQLNPCCCNACSQLKHCIRVLYVTDVLFALRCPQYLSFRFLQSRQKVQIWLYEQAELRIEGRIIV